jgi:hypothetical protein
MLRMFFNKNSEPAIIRVYLESIMKKRLDPGNSWRIPESEPAVFVKFDLVM